MCFQAKIAQLKSLLVNLRIGVITAFTANVGNQDLLINVSVRQVGGNF